MGNLNTQNVSINQILKKNQEKTEEKGSIYVDRPEKPFSFDQVKMIWKQLAFKMKENGMDTVYFALSKRNPQVFNEIEIHHECDNQIQIDIIQNNITDILDFVRDKLQNYTVSVVFKVIENQEENNKLLTGKDKFNVLSKKNANLFSLQKTFNLDIDY
jgi:DNA polymerase-3 subunit gamma/tau